jgi:hypothetical protein
MRLIGESPASYIVTEKFLFSCPNQINVLMKQKAFCLLLLSASLQVTSLKAQTCDPWITQAYKQLYGRAATPEECSIKNYNNGSWSSYEELVKYIKNYNSTKSASNNTAATMPVLQGDPWVFKIYQELYKRKPNAWELNINNYNSGSWTSYEQLKGFIQEYQKSIAKINLQVKTAPYNGNIATGFFIDGKQVAVNVVAAGGGNVVAAGGANAVAAGGANVVAAGGANVVAAGGGNIMINKEMAGVSFGGRYTTQSVGTQIIPTSGKGAILIRK